MVDLAPAPPAAAPRTRPRLLALLLVASCLGLVPRAAAERPEPPLQVVATLPELGEFARAIGGERVEVTVLARPGQNLHAVRVKPSHLVAVSRADVFVQVGLSLEHAWVPGLLEAARNPRIAPGRPGFVDAAAGYAAIDVPTRIDRAEAADVHPLGNPHVNLAVDGGPYLAERVLNALVALEPEHAEDFRANHAAWRERYDDARARWDLIAERVRAAERAAGHPLAVGEYHTEFDYLLRFLGLDVAATVEPAPGVPPTAAHLAAVVRRLRDARAPVVLTAPWSNGSATRKVARETGALVIELPITSGAGGEQDDWISTIDRALVRIAGAFGVEPPSPEEVARSREEAGAVTDTGDGGLALRRTAAGGTR